MNIFEKFDPQTWQKDTRFPYFSLSDDEGKSVYSGRNPAEFFEEFDIKYYQEYSITYWTAGYTYVKLGKVKEFKNGLPKLKLQFVVE